MSRAAASLAKNVFRQKIREAEKVAVYNEYIDQRMRWLSVLLNPLRISSL